MARLKDIQKREREALERLSKRLDRPDANNITEFAEILAACLHIAGLDPLPHLKAALKLYLMESE